MADLTDREIRIRADLAAAFEAGLRAKSIDHRIAQLEGADGRRIPIYLNDQGAVFVVEQAVKLLEHLEPGPLRRTGTSTHHELESFVDYVNRYAQPPSVVWADQSAFRVLAVLDYHPAGAEAAAGWAGHRAVYVCPRSAPWKAWTELDGRELKQDAFADFLEAHFEDLTGGDGYPKPADMVQLARDLQVHTRGAFSRKLNPTTGEASMLCKTENEHTSTPIPRAFLVGLPVFEGGDAYKVECRIRFRMAGEGAAVPIFRYEMYRRAEIERDAFLAVRKHVADKTGLPVFAGAPEAP